MRDHGEEGMGSGMNLPPGKLCGTLDFVHVEQGVMCFLKYLATSILNVRVHNCIVNPGVVCAQVMTRTEVEHMTVEESTLWKVKSGGVLLISSSMFQVTTRWWKNGILETVGREHLP